MRVKSYYILTVMAVVAAFVVLLLTGQRNYLLFHSITELFAIAVAFAIFLIAWNVRRVVTDGAFLILGVAYLFVGSLDLLHTLSYKGLGIFPDNANLATQLWVAARWLESASLLLAFIFIGRKVQIRWLLPSYAAVFILLLLSIFVWPIFPACFDPLTGLTPFKVFSEAGVIVVLCAALIILRRRKKRLDRRVFFWMVASIVATVASELLFMLYGTDPEGPINMSGHFLKIVSFGFIYVALVETGLRHPYDVLFRNLKNSQRQLQKAHDLLEVRVANRTRDLMQTVDSLQAEVAARMEAEEGLRRERQKLFAVLNILPGFVAIKDRNYKIRFANHGFLEAFSNPGSHPCYEIQCGRSRVCEECIINRVLKNGEPAVMERTYGNGRTYRVWSFPFVDTDGETVLLQLGVDITEQKELETLLNDTADVERRRIGRDLHDTLGQRLTGIGYMLGGLSKQLAETFPEQLDVVRRLNNELNDCIAQVRSLAHGLDPIGLDAEHFSQAIDDLVQAMDGYSDIACRFYCEANVELPPPHDLQLYRIAQEAITNAMRHSRAKSIDVTLRNDDTAVTLVVADDGVGLPEKLTGHDGMGVRVMHHRAEVVGAALTIERREPQGTILTCRVPKRSTRE